ncbi:polysaccharide deacetylase family protein [Glaciecola sp. MF2-115]|uniref:polysaccharide deacetylase family protein n=1 Tax=Glaciecola sp. MF2-115 TaxID=3384827 RepID=UPI0039A38987
MLKIVFKSALFRQYLFVAALTRKIIVKRIYFIALLSMSVTSASAFQANENGLSLTTPANNNNSFVILQYHHVSTETPRSTSVTPSELEQHLAYLSEFHNVVSLQTALDAIKSGAALPQKAVVITFDDGYKNILENGHSLIRKHGFDYTIFINPAQIGVLDSQLDWDDVKQMSKEGVTFANHTLDHLHLLDKQANESKSSWLKRIEKNIDMAENEIQEQLGYSKKWLVYPFGEFDTKVKDLLKRKGYLGFGQHSGAVGQLSDQQSLPRFPAAGNYANLETLKTKLNSLAMPVLAKRPHRYVMEIDEVLGELQIDIRQDDIQLSRIACYFRGESLPIEETDSGFSVDIKTPFKPGRTRINCTAPSNKQSDRFYWYSIPFFTAKEDGTYLD